jgi:hypothetical protein
VLLLFFFVSGSLFLKNVPYTFEGPLWEGWRRYRSVLWVGVPEFGLLSSSESLLA